MDTRELRWSFTTRREILELVSPQTGGQIRLAKILLTEAGAVQAIESITAIAARKGALRRSLENGEAGRPAGLPISEVVSRQIDAEIRAGLHGKWVQHNRIEGWYDMRIGRRRTIALPMVVLEFEIEPGRIDAFIEWWRRRFDDKCA